MAGPALRVPLGVFEARRPLARGGMGTVWMGVHVRRGAEVALKVLSRVDVEDAAALQAEIRVVAALDHPHIVRIYDAGVVDRAAERASGHQVLAGSPWLAMELLRGGGLYRRIRGPLDYRGARQILLDLLDALAHAHAHGVLHRDLKPGNILFTADGRLKLTDFGMGYVPDADTGWTPLGGGTPSWTAPEQIEGALTDQGPWTDLYAVGCLAWALCTGRPPFAGSAAEVLHAHLSQPLPPLDARFDVPPGVGSWVRQLTAKDPARRLKCAADVAWGLQQLAPGRTTVSVGSTPARVPLARTWRRPERAAPPRLAGTGLGVFGLRPAPLVGRERQRDALWSALRRVARSGRPEAVVLRGAVGLGKSQLARWLCRRAHELGAAASFRATHSPHDARLDGIIGLLGRPLRALDGVDPAVVGRALRRVGPAPEALVDGLCAVLAPLGGVGPGVRLTAGARHRLTSAAIDHLRDGRPAIVWVDDAQWGEDALAFVRALVLDARVPALCVVTVQDEALAERPAEDDAVEGLLAAGASAVAVRPLEGTERAELVAALMDLEPALAARVADRTEGNPQLAIQLLGDWVARGLLAPSPEGFRLDGAAPELPASIRALWLDRVERALDGTPEGWRPALEVAAVLGRDVDMGEWREACKHAGVRASGALVARLVALQLAEVDHGSGTRRWSFVHGMLREAIEEAAAPRLDALHRAAAHMLERRGPAGAARRAQHLEELGDWEAAAEAWLDAARRLRQHDLPSLHRALQRAEELLEEHADPDDPRIAHVQVRIARLIARSRGFDDPARIRRVERALAWAERHPRAGAGDLFIHLSHAARAQGDLEAARRHADEAVRRALGTWDPVAHAWALDELASVHDAAGDHAGSERALREALRVAPVQAVRAQVVIAMHLSLTLGQTGRAREGRELLASARALGDRSVGPVLQAHLRTTEAELARWAGDLEGALEGYAEALELGARAGAPMAVVHIDIALAQLALGRDERAEETFRRAAAGVDSMGRSRFRTWCVAGLAVTAARRGAWEEADELVAEVVEVRGADLDLAMLLAEVGRRADAAGRAELARTALGAARRHYERLGHEAAAEDLQPSRRSGE